AAASRRTRHERRGHRGQARHRLHRLCRQGAGLTRRGHPRCLPDAPDARAAGPRRRGRRRDDAAEVDLLLPEAADGDRFQPTELGSRAMTRIYTKKGDDGTTSLWYGGRVGKSDPRTEAYGALDEA